MADKKRCLSYLELFFENVIDFGVDSEIFIGAFRINRDIGHLYIF